MNRSLGFCAVAALSVLSLVTRAQAGGCPGPIALTNATVGSPEAGGFDVSGTPFAGKGSPGPELRFWAFGHFAQANSGTETQFVPKLEWISNLAVDYKQKTSANLFSVYQPTWYGRGIVGCIQDVAEKERRSVVEVSFADSTLEGSAKHTGYYAAMSVPPGPYGFNFDEVKDAGGPGKNQVKVEPIPAPRVVGKPEPLSGGLVKVQLELPEPVSYSEGGKNKPVNLFRGYRILYATGAEPTSSDPAKYKPAHDPKGGELAFVKPGASAVAVPAGSFLVAQLVFDDPDGLYSRATSAHVGLTPAATAPADAGSGRRSRKK